MISGCEYLWLGCEGWIWESSLGEAAGSLEDLEGIQVRIENSGRDGKK